MIERIHIENYKCLRDVMVDLGDFTILIGPNDSGKSSFLEVVRTLSSIVGQGYGGVFTGDRSARDLGWRKDATPNIAMQGTDTSATNKLGYRLENPGGQHPVRENL